MAKRKQTAWHTILWISVFTLPLAGCLSPGKNMMQHGDMTMADIYAKQTGSAITPPTAKAGAAPSSPMTKTPTMRHWAGSIVVGSSTQASPQAVRQAFKVLPNPSISAYIFPHMSHFNQTEAVVPGYQTAFFLYERNHYAMPEEVY